MNRAALIIGLNQDRASRSPPISRAESDARAIFQQLHGLTIDREQVFPRRRRTLLTGAKAASRSIGLALAGATPDLLLVYYSGAMRIDPARPHDPMHLLTADGDPTRDLSLARLLHRSMAQTLVLILDVLAVGGIDIQRAAAGLATLRPGASAPTTGYALLAACSRSPETREPPGISLGSFSAALVNGLTDTAALDQHSGELRVEQLARYVRAHILELTDRPPLLRYAIQGQAPLLARRMSAPQHTSLHAANHGADPAGSSLRCSRCDRPSSLGSLYLCERCGELYCARCVGQRGDAGGRCRRCACGGRII